MLKKSTLVLSLLGLGLSASVAMGAPAEQAEYTATGGKKWVCTATKRRKASPRRVTGAPASTLKQAKKNALRACGVGRCSLGACFRR